MNLTMLESIQIILVHDEKNAISKVFNVVFVLIYLDAVSGHGEKALFWGIAALLG